MCLGLREAVFRPNKPGRREYVQMHVLTLRCGFCKSRKTTLVKLVKRFNAKQMQKCSFDCLLLAFLLCGHFSIVLCTEYLTGWKGMQIPKPLPTPCISLVAGVDVVAHVEDEVAKIGE